MKILHFSPVKKENEIVNLHLESLKSLINPKNCQITYSFFDDNIDFKSTQLIKDYVKQNKNSILFSSEEIGLSKSKKFKERWEKELYNRITIIKDYVIGFFLKSDYDFLFLTDSDLVLHPETIINLVKQKKDFCAEIFWTHFDKGHTYSPNCWYIKRDGFDAKDLKKFRIKGNYEVDYTGACTLLSRKILNDNVRFEKISNVVALGEDKHFCIRAAVNNYKIYINSESPAFHIYNINLLNQAKKFIKNDYNLSYLDLWLDKEWEKKIESFGKPIKKTKIQYLKYKIKTLINI